MIEIKETVCTECCLCCDKWKTVKEQDEHCPTRRLRSNAMRRAVYKAQREKKEEHYEIKR